jgi:DNA-directed RNA polymerase II subunit RPB2
MNVLSSPPEKVPKKRGRKPKNAVTIDSSIATNAKVSLPIELMMEAEKTQKNKEVETTESFSSLLEHLGSYRQEPFDVLQSYFDIRPLERLVRHQLESYNHFVNYQMQRTIEMFNPITIKSDNDYNEETGTYGLVVKISLKNVRFQQPQIYENNGSMKTMFPEEARLRNFTYSSTSLVDLHIEYVILDEVNEERTICKTIPNIKLCNMPIMLKSSICILSQYKHLSSNQTEECGMDCGGYFIIKGSEKTVLCQERAAENRIYVFNGKNTPKWSWIAEFKSVPDSKCISPKQVEMMVSSKTNVYGHGIYVVIPKLKQKRYIELFVLFRALGVLSDKEICEYILLDVNSEKNKPLLQYLEASIEDAKPFIKEKDAIQEDAMEQLMSMVSYNPYQSEKGAAPMKKIDYTKELLIADFFPHCKSAKQKCYLLGFMVNRLIRTALGWNPPDDRDSYINKRIELPGSLLNNLFRNHYIRFVKEIEKQVLREINIGAWKSSEEY